VLPVALAFVLAALTEEPIHWAFVAPRDFAPPATRSAHWSRGALDHFVLARLEAERIAPAGEEEPRRLLRRLALDLTGLPPSLAEADAFAATTPEAREAAYAAAVERFLASPAYGERFARVFLDLFRHADTKGYEKDQRRETWPFRDWLIRSLDADMPYPAFTERVLAGDLLQEPTPDDLVATAMHRNTMANDEGGTDDEEFRIAAVKDRVDTTMQVWLGVTFGCAKCHSHKSDPIPQVEYYRVMAFFDQTEDADRGDDAPTMPYTLGPDAPAVQLPILRELPVDQRRTTRVHERGSFLDPGEVVSADTPSCLPPFPPEQPRNRLGLARWLTARDNPLAARVLVNRIWALFFGRGIVETEEDFGKTGTAPSHPELLDDLAVRFMASGWSLKWLCREIVMSATYRQCADASASAIERDPRNDLLGRGPRNRLEAEAVRDQALAIAGLLSAKRFGPSVMPRQPDGIWAVVYSEDRWATSPGDDAHRRSLYTFVRRTSAYPAALAFDAPTREICTVRRITTNTPLQALVTLNDPVFVEAAQALARSEGASADRDAAATVRALFRRVTLRDADADEVALLERLYSERLAHYQSDPTSAVAMAEDPLGPLADRARVAELAAWTTVANVLLNLDEVLTR
jgi:Protein of unknown function (DUF1553)/Protein of unknown function (DUF1549)